MVNFKAGGHQGEHKRALASQENGETHGVSKPEKLAMGRDPASLAQPVNASGVPLRVVAREKFLQESNGTIKVALVHDGVSDAFGAKGYICRPGGDHVLSVRSHEVASPGSILLNEAQRLSLHVCEDEIYEWVPHAMNHATPVLADLSLECQLMNPRNSGAAIEVEAQQLVSLAGKAFFGELVSTNELFIVSHAGESIVLRVVEVNQLAPDDSDGDSGMTPHCFRGLVQPQTQIFISLSTSFYAHRGAIDGLKLLHPTARPSVAPRNCIRVLTSDGEEFPVARQLLRPCISLTKVVRDLQASDPQVSVDVECCIFDRVLMFLEVKLLSPFSC